MLVSIAKYIFSSLFFVTFFIHRSNALRYLCPKEQIKLCEKYCKPKCDGLDISCELTDRKLIRYCEQCIDPCNDLGVSIAFVVADPPFHDQATFCQWCASSCSSGKPNCFQSYCANCETECSGTSTTSTVSSTPDAELQECLAVCYPQCNNRDMSCQSNWTNYCYECAPRCQDKGVEVFYLFSDPPFGDEAAMCDWCFNQCFVENPSCIHGGCWMCDPDCRTKTTTTTTITTTTVSSTPNLELQNCFEFCYPQCNGRNLNCKSSWTGYCEECAPRCRDLGIEVEYVYGDPPFDEPGFCNWCESQCYGRNPSCDHVYCGSCDPICAKSTTTTISTTTSST